MTFKTWPLATLEACLSQADNLKQQFTRKQLKEQCLEQIVAQTGSQGKTPAQTLSRIMQDLRDLGFIKFVKRGLYQLLPISIQQDQLIKTERKMSKGERLVSRLLIELGIDYQREKTFKTLKDKGFLRFDFYFEIQGRGFAIEFDGEQHRRPVDFFGGETAFKERVKRDQIKEQWCQENNITLIRIEKCDANKARRIVAKAIYEDLSTKPRLRSEVKGSEVK